MGLKHFILSADGRVCRKSYWFGSVGTKFVAGMFIGFALAILSMTNDGTGPTAAGFLVAVLCAVTVALLFWGSLMLAIKRCHDRNRSGWFILANLIPVAGTIWVFIELGCARGTPGGNRFGDDPLSGADYVYAV